MESLRRRGNALVIVLALALLLAAQISIISTLNSGNLRHLNKVTAHVRAKMVAESAYSGILTRIRATEWADRWYANAPAIETDVPLVGGSYSSYIATVPSTSDHFADVWIRGRYDTSTAVMYWRVKVVEDTLDFSARVYPQFFTHLPSEAPAPSGSVGDPTTTLVENMMGQQKANRGRTIDVLKTLDPITDLPGITAKLGVPVAGPPVDTRQGVSAPIPQPPYVAAAKAPGLPPLPATPPPVLITPPPQERTDDTDARNWFHHVHDRDGWRDQRWGHEDHGDDHHGDGEH